MIDKSKFVFIDEKSINTIFERFLLDNPNPQTELVAPNDYTLLVSVVLSAQATDKSVNKATESLYKIVQTPQQMIDLGEEKLIQYIKSIGLYKVKAKHIIELSEMLIEKYNSVLPNTRENLESLPGVGRKTANVILNVVYGQPTMPVDTHLLRIAPRIGLSNGKTPIDVEKDLIRTIPSQYMEHAHHWLILHGRYICKARNPQCEKCFISDLCAKNGINSEEV